MHLNGSQWKSLILLDFFLRAGYILLVNYLDPLALFISIFLSALYLTILYFVGGLATRPSQSPRASNAVFALIANAIFVAIFISIWIAFIKSGDQTACTGWKPDCNWIKGAITWRGVWTLTLSAIVMTGISIISLLAVGGFKSRPEATLH
jgi:hypothetical protein